MIIDNKKMKIIKGINCITNESIEIKIDNSIIVSIEKINEKDLPFIGSGLCDLQINGYAGIDYNTLPLKAEDIETTAKEMIKDGVTTFLPTIITNSDKNIKQALKTIKESVEKSKLLKKAIGGIHLEGPFISPKDGARGAHDKQHIKAPDRELFQEYQEAAGGLIKIITISPEWENTDEFIENCVKNNVIVSIGHSNATPQQIKEAINAGATMSTHLGNGAIMMLPRHPNFIWEQLAQDKLNAGLIADGFHLPDSFLKVALRAKKDNAFLVSDTTKFTGMKAGKYKTHIGGEVLLTKEGRLCVADSPEFLAGAALPLLSCIEHLVFNNICELGKAWEMASTKPCILIGKKNEIAVNEKAELVVFRLRNKNIIIEDVIN